MQYNENVSQKSSGPIFVLQSDSHGRPQKFLQNSCKIVTHMAKKAPYAVKNTPPPAMVKNASSPW